MRVLSEPCRSVVLALLIAALSAHAMPAAAGTPGCPAPDSPQILLSETHGETTLATTSGEEIVLSALAFPTSLGDDEGAIPPFTADVMAGFGGKPVHVATAGAPDRYNRLHAYVYSLDGRLLQAELVAAGLAVVRPDGVPPVCARLLLGLEDSARKARLGLWRNSRMIAKATEESSLSARNGLYGLVEGRVVSIGYGSRLVFVDFGRNYRTDFTVMMQNALVPRLREAGISLESLSGRAVRVRGIIEESGGPAIRIADPFALELLDRTE